LSAYEQIQNKNNVIIDNEYTFSDLFFGQCLSFIKSMSFSYDKICCKWTMYHTVKFPL